MVVRTSPLHPHLGAEITGIDLREPVPEDDQAFGEEGPGLDLDFDTLEQVAVDAAQALIKGTIEQALRQQLVQLGAEQPCPTCERACPVETVPREIVVRAATVVYDEPKCHCPSCRRDFFPSPSRAPAGRPSLPPVAP